MLTVGPLAIGALRQSHSRAGVPSRTLSALQIYCLISLYVKKLFQANAVANNFIWFVVSWVAWPLGDQVWSRCFQRGVSLTTVLSFFSVKYTSILKPYSSPKAKLMMWATTRWYFSLTCLPFGKLFGFIRCIDSKGCNAHFLLFDSSSWQTLVAGRELVCR